MEVARRVLEEIDEINRAFPQMRIMPVINQGNFIERSIANVARSVLYGGALAVLVLLFFLRNLRSTLVISLAIPISMLATFALLYFGGFTLNLMTLGGLALGVGMMVDSSVVVLENIFRRHQERGEEPRRAAVAGTREVASAVDRRHRDHAGDLPAAGLRAGRLRRAVQGTGLRDHVLAGLRAAGGARLVPMLASKLLRSTQRQDSELVTERIGQGAAAAFTRLENGYRDLLDFTLHHRLAVILISMLIFAASLLLIPLSAPSSCRPATRARCASAARWRSARGSTCSIGRPA